MILHVENLEAITWQIYFCVLKVKLFFLKSDFVLLRIKTVGASVVFETVQFCRLEWIFEWVEQ